MESTSKKIYGRLSVKNKKSAVDAIVNKTKRKKITVKQLWIWGDAIPEEHQKSVEKILKKILNEQETENSRKETV